MTSIAYSPVSIQTSSQAAPLPPPWFGEVVLIVAHLRKQMRESYNELAAIKKIGRSAIYE